MMDDIGCYKVACRSPKWPCLPAILVDDALFAWQSCDVGCAKAPIGALCSPSGLLCMMPNAPFAGSRAPKGPYAADPAGPEGPSCGRKRRMLVWPQTQNQRNFTVFTINSAKPNLEQILEMPDLLVARLPQICDFWTARVGGHLIGKIEWRGILSN